MGFENEHANVMQPKRWCCFDVETAIRPEARQYFPAIVEDYDSIKADGRLKDEAKIIDDIQAKCQKAKEDAAAARAAQIEKAPLDANACRIVSIGWQTEIMPEPVVWLAPDEAAEKDALEAFWGTAYGRTLYGYYSRGFDIGRIIHRSRLTAVKCPRHWRRLIAPYGRADGHVDLYDEWTLDGSLKISDQVVPNSLVHACRIIGADIPEDDGDGADIAQLVAAERWDEVRLHNMRDIQRTVALARWFGFVPQAQTQTAAEVF